MEIKNLEKCHKPDSSWNVPFFKLVHCMTRPSHCLLDNVSMQPDST